MTAAFFGLPGTGVAGIGAGAVPADRTLRAVARSFVLCSRDDLRVDFGLGTPRPALLAAAVLADGFMIRTSFRCSGAAWRRHRHKPRRHYRLGLWDPRFGLAAGDQRHARSVGRGSPVDLARRENDIWRCDLSWVVSDQRAADRNHERDTRRRSELFCKNPTLPHHVERCRGTTAGRGVSGIISSQNRA